MSAKQKPSRKHHYVPVLMLKGFTRGGGEHDDLHTVDAARRMYRRGTPRKEGYRNDFYRVDLPGVEPMAIEDLFAEKAEPHFAEVLRWIAEHGELPVEPRLRGALIGLISMLHCRVPANRVWMQNGWSKVLSLMDRMPRNHYPSFQKAMRDRGEDDSPEAFKEYQQGGDERDRDGGRWIVDRTTLVKDELELAARLFKVFSMRTWALVASESADAEFICSDNPVVLVAPKVGAPVGLGLRDTTVFMPLSRRHALIGTWSPTPVNRAMSFSPHEVAAFNTRIIAASQEVIWAPSPDFVFLGRGDEIWRGHKALLKLVRAPAAG